MTWALGLSILAVVLSALSLGWQAWAFARSGPVVKVRCHTALLPPMSGRYIGVEATNKGRSPCTVESWGIETPEGQIVQPMAFPHSSPLPSRLEPHSSVSYFVAATELQNQSYRLQVPFSQMRPYVKVAGKGRIYAPNPVPL